MTAAGWGGLLTLVAIVLAAAGLLVVHLAPTGLNPLRDPVSQYHLTRYRPWIAASTICTGLAGIASIVAITGLLGSAGLVCSILLAVFAAARILIPFLRMDAPGSGRSAVGRIHTLLAFVGFGAVTAAAFVAGGALHDGGFASAATWSTGFGVLMAVGAVGLVVGLAMRRSGLFGLFERLIYLGFVCWFVLIGIVALAG